MLRNVAFCVFFLAATTVAYAQSSDQVIDEILWHMDDLEARVSALEAELIVPLSDNTDTLDSSESSDEWADDAFEWSVSTLEPDAAVSPSHNTDWLGFMIGSAGWADLEAWLARPIWVAHTKLAFGKRGFNQALNDRQKAKLEAYTTLAPHVQLSLILNLYPRSKPNGPEFSAIIAGQWDVELRHVARRLIDTGQEDAILRLWHEPEIKSKSWCEDPDYVAAWQYVHDIFMSELGAAFEWQYSVNNPAARQQRSSDGTLWIDKCYPGAAYVDQLSVGTYDRSGGVADVSWQNTLAKLVFIRDWALARGHRFSVAEWGLWHPDCKHSGQGDNPSLIQRSHDFFAAVPEGSRGYMLYFNRDACANLDQFPESRALFKELFGG